MSKAKPSSRYIRVASDVGGTFTDNISYDKVSRRITITKVPTTPQNRAIGTVQGLMKAVALQGANGKQVEYVGHGMTTATNAVIQRKGARTAFLTNHGFKDLLLIGRQDRPHLYDINSVRPTPLVPSELCFTVRGRLDYQGNEIEPLDVDALSGIAAQLQENNVEALAICLLHSYINPQHEALAKRTLQALMPTLTICASTDILREFREYERGSTTVLNAFLQPVMDTYLGSLLEKLHDEHDGLGIADDVPVMLMEASGGMMTVQTAREKPVHTVLSGPAGGVVASAYVAELSGIRNLITIDIGGTSTDISLIRDGKAAVTRQASLETIPIRIPVLDINAIGAGGGSIAWIDGGGALRVGPLSAEAVPGPACYELGGTEPTVTDANLVLGRLGTRTRLGGDLLLSYDAAHRVIDEKIAKPLGMTVQEAASGILRVAHANIVRGIRVVSVERGYDPRECVLVPYGGAGPLHGTPVSYELGIKRILVPPTPGILCALGQLVSDVRHELVEGLIDSHENVPAAKALEIFRTLQQQADELLIADGIPAEARRFVARVDARYMGQSYELTIYLPEASESAWNSLTEMFHQEHEQRFGHSSPDTSLQIVSLGLIAEGIIEAPQLPSLPQGEATPPVEAHDGTRQVYFEVLNQLKGGQYLETPIFRREALLAGNVITGPAIIEEISSTTTLYPGDVATVQPQGSLIVELNDEHI